MTIPIEELNVPIVALNAADSPTDVESLKTYGIDVVIMPVGHFAMLEAPARFNAALRNVIRRWR